MRQAKCPLARRFFLLVCLIPRGLCHGHCTQNTIGGVDTYSLHRFGIVWCYNLYMQKIRVGVVRGGPSSEYAISLKTGENVLKNLDQGKYAPVDVLLTTRGDWYMNGMRVDLGTIAEQVDVVWNALHGTFGEDGKAQQLFESFGIPYTGSGVLASAIGMNKELAKERFNTAGLHTLEGETVSAEENLSDAAFRRFQHGRLPVMVKPLASGSSVGITLARTFSELAGAIEKASQHGDVLIEEYVEGIDATVGVVDDTSGGHFALHPVEIVPPEENAFYDYDAKYGGESEMICPGRFSSEVSEHLRDMAVKAHRAVGAKHYSRTDFIVSSKGIYVLEINTLPGLSVLFPRSLRASGAEFSEFLDHVIGLALAR